MKADSLTLALLLILSCPAFAFAVGPEGVEDPSTQQPRRVYTRQVSSTAPLPMANIVTAPPETATPVKFSSTDVNRIVCSAGTIQDVVFSKEKGVDVKIFGRNAFVKFMVKINPGGKEEYSHTPTEFFVVCDGDIYTLVADPLRIPSQTVRLSSGKKSKIKKNVTLMRSLPWEKKAMLIIRDMYTGDLPDSWDVTTPSTGTIAGVIPGLRVSLARIVEVAGEGLRGKEYSVTLAGDEPVTLAETMFIKLPLTVKPIAVSLDTLRLLNHGDTARLFIVEKSKERL